MNDKTPRDILSKFYTDNHLDQDGGNSKSFVKIEATSWFHFYIPNFDARRRAVIKHDIHHILTGYNTTFKGECEISTWEIASGCKKYWAAFFIDIGAMMIGMPLYFRSILRAFARGRRTKNLYGDLPSTEDAMKMKIPELQKLFSLDKHGYDTRVNFTDLAVFTGFACLGLVYSISSILTLPLLLIYSLYIALFVDKD